MENNEVNEVSAILRTSIKLVKLLDKGADSMLPRQIVDVVKLHSKLALGSAWIPIPGVDMAAGAASIWGMYIRINNKIGVTVKENVIKTVASGVATNLASYAAASGVASALKFIPGIGTITGAIAMSATTYAVTLASGYVYLQALVYLAEKNNGKIDFSGLSSAVKRVLDDKSTIQEIIADAKRNYKK